MEQYGPFIGGMQPLPQKITQGDCGSSDPLDLPKLISPMFPAYWCMHWVKGVGIGPSDTPFGGVWSSMDHL